MGCFVLFHAATLCQSLRTWYGATFHVPRTCVSILGKGSVSSRHWKTLSQGAFRSVPHSSILIPRSYHSGNLIKKNKTQKSKIQNKIKFIKNKTEYFFTELCDSQKPCDSMNSNMMFPPFGQWDKKTSANLTDYVPWIFIN